MNDSEQREAVIARARGLFEIPDFDEIIRLVALPDVRDEPDAIFLLALAEEGNGEAERALAAAHRLIDIGDERGAATVAERLWNADRIEESLQWFERAIAGGDREAELNFARGLLWLDRRDDAVVHLKSLIADDDWIGDEASGVLGLVMAVGGDLGTQTVSWLKRGQVREPDARAWLGVVHLNRGGIRRGVALLESALADGSTHASVKLGNYYLDEGQLRDAERAYRVGVSGGDVFARFNLGKMIHENFSARRREALRLIKSDAQSGDVVAKAWFRRH